MSQAIIKENPVVQMHEESEKRVFQTEPGSNYIFLRHTYIGIVDEDTRDAMAIAAASLHFLYDED